MRKLLLALTALSTGVAAYWFNRRNRWRTAYTMELVEHIQDELSSAEREFFDVYRREDTRRNIHNALAYLIGEYAGNITSFRNDLNYVSNSLIEVMIADDPEGRAAYLELQKYLNQIKSMLDELTPEPDFFDKLRGGIWYERTYDAYDYPPEKPGSYLLYDPVITPKIVYRRKYPRVEFSTKDLNLFSSLRQIRSAEVGND